MSDPGAKILSGEISIPYRWATGAAVGRFLTALRDEARIYGARCPSCRLVFCPPQEFCGRCYGEMGEWVGLSGEGTVESVTRVELPLVWRPMEPPYLLLAVRLDGADTALIHLGSAADEARLGVGARARAVFKAQRTGTILDIERFEPA